MQLTIIPLFPVCRPRSSFDADGALPQPVVCMFCVCMYVKYVISVLHYMLVIGEEAEVACKAMDVFLLVGGVEAATPACKTYVGWMNGWMDR